MASSIDFSVVLNSAQEDGCHFSLDNVPFGVFCPPGSNDAVVGTAVGSYAIDLSAAARSGLFTGSIMEEYVSVFSQSTLNEFMSIGRQFSKTTRRLVQALISGHTSLTQTEDCIIYYPLDSVQMLMPIAVGDYTDFYSSKEHATNVGIMFRGKENALNPNWVHMPIAYHGRSSSVIPSGTAITRPSGQLKLSKDTPNPVFGPSQKLDFELEMAFVVGKGNQLGKSISVDEADDHIFGVVLMNDWSGTPFLFVFC
jgi:fumarylacetoacetase